MSGRSGGALLAPEKLLSWPSGSLRGGSGVFASSSGSPRPVSQPSPTFVSPRASPACLTYIKRRTNHSGFSSRVARRLALCHRSSPRIVYHARWATYRRWCRSEGHSLSRPSVAQVADFLLFLHHWCHLSYSAVTLATIFRLVLPALGSSSVLEDLLRPFSLSRPLRVGEPPPWDLALVLRFLMGAPFEPLHSASLRDLTRTSLFLVALATARRLSALQAVSSVFSKQGAAWVLS